MSELQIIGAPGSNFVWATRIACVEKGLPYTLVPTFPHTPEVTAIHPFGKIPVLRHGEVTLCESRAICAYLDHFEGPPLMPPDAVNAARAEQWVSIVSTHVDPLLVRQYLGAYFFPGTPDGSPDRRAIDAALPGMRTQFAVLDAAVATSSYLAAGAFTLADMNLLPILFYMNKMPESRALLAGAGHLRAYFERHMERRSVKDTIPESMPDNFVKAIAAAQAA